MEEAAAKEQEKSDDAYNASTGSYSGLYGQKPVDDQTQSTLDEILNASSSQCNIDSLVEAAKSEDVTLPPERIRLSGKPMQFMNVCCVKPLKTKPRSRLR